MKYDNGTKKRLSVIIPVYNEVKTIGKVISSVLSQKGVYEIILVDDGSTDNTLYEVGRFKNSLDKNKSKLRIVLHEKNLGKGAAIRTGLEEVEGDFVIIQDADLEYNPSEYANLTEHVNNKTAVYGSRLIKDNPRAYFFTLLANVLLTRLVNFLFGTKITDSYTCFKLIPVNVFRSLGLVSNGFEIEAEITGKLAKAGIKIVEVPISYSPRSYEQGKKIKAKDAMQGALTLFRVKLFN